MKTTSSIAIVLFAAAVVAVTSAGHLGGRPTTRRPRFLDQFAKKTMLESGSRVASEPECRFGLGWIYHGGNCYLITSYHEMYDNAVAACESVGAYMADVLSEDEENFLKSVLDAVNPKDGTDYFLGGTDVDGDGNMVWLSGKNIKISDSNIR